MSHIDSDTHQDLEKEEQLLGDGEDGNGLAGGDCTATPGKRRQCTPKGDNAELRTGGAHQWKAEKTW
jgi:hypothetical protein